jgi:hypothetical protein
MLFVVVGFLQALNLTIVAEPVRRLLDEVFAYLPALLGAAALGLVAWLVAGALRWLVQRVFRTLKIDQRLSSQADIEAPDEPQLSRTFGNVVYWLVLLLFLPAILGALGLQGLLVPVQGMVDEVLGVLPNIFGAGVVLLVGWLVARVVRRIITNLMMGAGADRLGEETGLSAALGEGTLSEVVGTIVYVLILIPVAIAALNALQIEAVSQPAAEMLTTLLNAIPAVFGAFVLIGVAYFVARWVGGFVTNVLSGIGFDNVLVWIGIQDETTQVGRTPSEIVGYLSVIAIMVFALIEAADLLGFTILADLVSALLVASGGVLLGLVIFGIGLYLSQLAHSVVMDAGGSQAHLLAPLARWAIIVLAGALGLRQMGIAEDIVNLAFGLLLGAIAVAAALAFGLGSRDIAARELSKWLEGARGSEPSGGGEGSRDVA